jgi:hypothetical protein
MIMNMNSVLFSRLLCLKQRAPAQHNTTQQANNHTSALCLARAAAPAAGTPMTRFNWQQVNQSVKVLLLGRGVCALISSPTHRFRRRLAGLLALGRPAGGLTGPKSTLAAALVDDNRSCSGRGARPRGPLWSPRRRPLSSAQWARFDLSTTNLLVDETKRASTTRAFVMFAACGPSQDLMLSSGFHQQQPSQKEVPPVRRSHLFCAQACHHLSNEQPRRRHTLTKAQTSATTYVYAPMKSSNTLSHDVSRRPVCERPLCTHVHTL